MIWRDLAVIKGVRDGFLVRLDDEEEFVAVIEQLRKKLEGLNGFMRGAGATVDLGTRKLSGEQSEQLLRLLRDEHGVDVREVANSARREPLVAEGEDLTAPPPPEAPAGRLEPRLSRGGRRHAQDNETRALFVPRTLRSGQSIHFDGNVVVLGDVNPGAEVVAAGNIVVWGSLRGMAHAGARGDAAAVVTALCLAPTQLRIASFIGRSPDQEAPVRLQPEAARIKDGIVIIEPCLGRVLSSGGTQT